MTPGSVRDWLAARRALAGKFLFEIAIVFVGVSAAFALEGWRQERADRDYRLSVIAALGPTLDDVVRHNQAFERFVGARLRAFDAALARGERPSPPIYRERNSERAPTRVWDAIVVTGAARALGPDLLFRLGLFYTRQDSWGERYLRYNTFTEERVFTLASPAAMYDTATGKLRPEFAAHLDRLRNLRALNFSLTEQAIGLRAELQRFGRN